MNFNATYDTPFVVNSNKTYASLSISTNSRGYPGSTCNCLLSTLNGLILPLCPGNTRRLTTNDTVKIYTMIQDDWCAGIIYTAAISLES